LTIERHQLTAGVLREACGHGAYERGRGYFATGRATVIEVHSDDDGSITLLTTNRGSGRHTYDQEITLVQNRHGLGIDGYCDCPVGYNCKHVVAGCLAWKEQAGPAPGAGEPFERWLARLEDETRPGEAPQEALLYLLVPEVKTRSGRPALRLHFAIAKRKASGEWGKGRRTHLSSLGDRWHTSRYMQPLDTEIIALLGAADPYNWGTGVTLRGAAGRTALDLMVHSGRLFFGLDRRLGPLRQGGSRPLRLGWERLDGSYHLRLEGDGDMDVIPVAPPCYVDPPHLEVGPLELPGGMAAEKIPLLEQAPPVSVDEARRISRLLALRHPGLPTPTEVSLETFSGAPTPALSLRFQPQPPAIHLRLAFDYAGEVISAADPAPRRTVERGEGLLRIERDPTGEARAGERLLAAGAEPSPLEPGHFTLPLHTATEQAALAAWFALLDTTVPDLEAEGWRVLPARESPARLGRAEEIGAEVETSGNDWFGLRFDLEVAGRRVPLLPLVSGLLADYRPGELPERLHLDAGDGQYIAVEGARIEPILQTIIDLYDRDAGGDETLHLSRLDAPRLLDLGETRVRGGKVLQDLARRLRDFDGIRPVKPPSTFKGTLRTYQQRGLDWLQFLREYGLAGILADDMGLGKTVQTLVHLAVEKRAGRMGQPSLIIAPTSLMGNWRREAAQFTPKLKVLVLHGPERGRHFERLGDHDLVLTTYPLLPRDAEVLLQQPWHYLILDEAQQIKNPRAQAARLVRELRANHRLCLTGTPMENHLGELWAQFDFLLPGFLGDRRSFARTYRTPIEKQGDRARLQRLTRRTAPFMLRRTKEIVASELPQKTELLRTVPLPGRQAAIYESIRLTMEKRVRDAIARKGLARSHITILDALLKLRQVCCDPQLLPKTTRGIENAGSAKLEMLMELLPEMLAEGRRILLFSQFTTMLGLIEKELEARHIPYAKLTGQTRKREAAIEAFRGGAADLFLISLKAGGVGLNLTEADTVIHYDPWWNPAVEAQATDRAHRIGQDKPVFVYKLITEGTVEEKILALQAKKRALADNIYGDGETEDGLPVDADTVAALLSGE
jgi:superfamily II DNA or RNA helicase